MRQFHAVLMTSRAASLRRRNRRSIASDHAAHIELRRRTSRRSGRVPFGVSTQMTRRRQNVDAMAEMDWTEFLALSIGHDVKFDTHTPQF